MDFQSLNRRELQALCKLNKIPANITNVAMVDALKSLNFVEGIEDFLKPSQSSETNESSIESPGKTEVMSPRAPRTSCRTSTRKKPLRDEAEIVKTVTRTTRRGVRKQIAGEVEELKTSNVPETPVVSSSRRRTGQAATARLNMDAQLKESKDDVKVDDSMDPEKKCVPGTPAAVPNSRRKGPAASSRRSNLKEESVIGRTYSTRRSVRLAEVKQAEPTPMEKQAEPTSTSEEITQSFEDKLDEGSDDFSAALENLSLTGSNNMDNVIPSDLENTSELKKLEKSVNFSLNRDICSEETTPKDTEVDVHLSENENRPEISKLENVENISSYGVNLGLVEVSAAVMANVVPDNKGVDNVYQSETENPSETLKQENVEIVATSEDVDSCAKTAVEMEIVVQENEVEVVLSHTEKSNEHVLDDAEMESDELKSSDSAAQNQNQDFEVPVLHSMEYVENDQCPKEMESDELKVEDSAAQDRNQDFELSVVNPIDNVENQGLTEMESDESDSAAEDQKQDFEVQEQLPMVYVDDQCLMEKKSDDLKVGDSAAQDQNQDVENQGPIETESEDLKLSDSAAQDQNQDFEVPELHTTDDGDSAAQDQNQDVEVSVLHPIDNVENQGLTEMESDDLKWSDSASHDQNQDFEVPELLTTDDVENQGLAKIESDESKLSGSAEEMSNGNAMLADGETSQESIEVIVDDVSGEVPSTNVDLDATEKVADISRKQAGVYESEMEISDYVLPLTSIPSSEMNAIPTQAPTKSRGLVVVSDDKENIDLGGRKLQLPSEMGKKMKKKEEDLSKKLHEKSMRQLQKMLKEKLYVTKSVKTDEEESSCVADTMIPSVTKARAALQTLSSNSLADTAQCN